MPQNHCASYTVKVAALASAGALRIDHSRLTSCMKTVKMKIQILMNSFLDFMREKTLKIVTVILQGFKRLDISICLIFYFYTLKLLWFQRCILYKEASHTPKNTVLQFQRSLILSRAGLIWQVTTVRRGFCIFVLSTEIYYIFYFNYFSKLTEILNIICMCMSVVLYTKKPDILMFFKIVWITYFTILV
jgi:hypothetical protein